MTTYARIYGGFVHELFEPPPALSNRPIEQLFNPGAGSWVDITNADPKPAPGWSYDGATFSPPPPIDAGEARVDWWRRYMDPVI